MDFRKTSDRIPETFDQYRPRYCEELFNEIVTISSLNGSKNVLEIGPGTGQATEPILKTGCNYKAIELGENFTDYMKRKYKTYNNFDIINADFETYEFDNAIFDLVYSAEYKSKFYTGIKKAILDAEDKIIIHNTILLYVAKKHYNFQSIIS